MKRGGGRARLKAVVPKTTVPVEGTLGSNPSHPASDNLLTEIDVALGAVWDKVKLKVTAVGEVLDEVKASEPEVNACDTCPKPGTCCSGFPLFPTWRENPNLAPMTKLEVMVWAAGVLYAMPDKERTSVGLPFLPVKLSTTPGGHPVWIWQCVDLLPNGRCGNYDNRPYGPCVLYKPGQDRLCAISPDFEPWL